jgi:UDP-N-acetylmuramoyl-L-alanyl-D-glutamate--2,6-diaminopimelate ligase
MQPAQPATLGELLDACFDADGRSLRGHSRLLEAPPAERLATPISALAYDSRATAPNALFCCIPGFQSDGHDHAAQAIASGASALALQRPLGLGVPEVLVDSVRAAIGPLADAFFAHPSGRMSVIGVTGTNGKTTTTFLVRALLRQAGVSCGLLGTVKQIVGEREQPASRTTPEAPDINGALARMLQAGDRACAMEVSSHALALRRTDGVDFAVALFTNLTQDHLDFHPTIEDYFAAKRRLFESDPRSAVINLGDPYGARLAAEIEGAITFALLADRPHDPISQTPIAAGRLSGERAPVPSATLRARIVAADASGSRFLLEHPGGEATVALSLPGRFNVENALGALAAMHALGFELAPLLPALARPIAVPGRMEALDAGQPFSVLIDYAHTPDSLARVLAAARELLEQPSAAGSAGKRRGRVLCVFGAGGDRDRAKRPLMGEAAARGADLLILTSDNPRSEDPEAIIDQIRTGVDRARWAGREEAKLEVIVDRRAAIEHAIALAQEGDILLIAGKGHERGQELAGGRVVAFDDAQVAREAIAQLSPGRFPGAEAAAKRGESLRVGSSPLREVGS